MNVGGKIFETTRHTLTLSSYFNSYFSRWNSQSIIFIDRSYKLFEHVLAYLRNPNYPFPVQHKDELDFYGINHDFGDYKDQLSQLEEEIKRLKGCLQTGSKPCKNDGCNNSTSKLFDYCFECAPLQKVDDRRCAIDGNYRNYIESIHPIHVLYEGKTYKPRLAYPSGECYIVTENGIPLSTWKIGEKECVYQSKPESKLELDQNNEPESE